MTKDISQTNIFTTKDLLDELKNRTSEVIALTKSQIITELTNEIEQQKKIIKGAYTAISIYQKLLKELEETNEQKPALLT